MIYNIMKELPCLTDSQKKKIKRNSSLNFYKELDKINDQKEKYFRVFSEQIKVLINNLDNNGVLFYSVDIELSFLNQNLEEAYKEIEEFINYIGSNIELIEFCYFAIELNDIVPLWQQVEKINEVDKNIYPCIRGIIGVRTITGLNSSLFFELKDLFILPFFDVKIQWLLSYLDIYEYWIDIINQKNFKFHRFVNYSNFFSKIYGSIADEELKFEDRFAFGQENHFISDTMNISGVKKKFPQKKELVLYFLDLIMYHNNMKLHKNKIYIKKKENKISWHIFFDLDKMKEKFIFYFEELKILYPQQLGYFDITSLVLNDLDSVFLKLKKNNSLLNKDRENFFDQIIEFKDGIFFFKEFKFLKFDDINNLYSLKTIFYIDYYYSDLNLADFWLKFFMEKYGEKDFSIFLKELNLKKNK